MPTTEPTTIAAEVAKIAGRWPTVGLAAGVIRDGALESFAAHGLADIATGCPVTEDTVFRIGSVTKTFTAIAVMQLWERGLIHLDAPAKNYLRAFRLVPARPGWRPATVRHLLTHTAGIREVLHPSGLLRMRDLGETIPHGRPVPSLAEYYRGALRVDAEPGTRCMYTNHGFAALGQLIADVTGQPLAVHLREHILDPLGLDHTDLVRSDRVRLRTATGYELGRRGAVAIADYELIPAGAGGLYSTPRDMASYLAALLGGGSNAHGSILKPETLAEMFRPQFQPDPRIPGLGLAFFRTDLGGHPGVEHDGILPGFDTQILLAPDDGIAVMAFANGAKRGLHWLAPEAGRVMRRLLGVPEPAIRTDVAQRPDVWADLCGRYRFSAHRTDPARILLGAGAQVLVRRGHLLVRFLSPVPALYRGLPLHPDDPHDPRAFRIELPWFGLGSCRAVFGTGPDGVPALHLEIGPLTFTRKRSGSIQ